MNKILTLGLAVGLAPLAFAADGNSSSATAQASVTILAPVTVTAQGSLQFGKVVVSAVPTAIKISSGAVVSTDSNATVYVHPGTTSVPSFSITKDGTASVQVVFGQSFTAGAQFAVDPGAVNAVNTFATSGDTSYLNKPLFGTLSFPAGTVPNGAVTGTVTITANYI
jgi:hypothetical protein